MMKNLTETQRNVLRWIVDKVSEGKLPEEEIYLNWSKDGLNILGYEGDFPSFKRHTIDGLANAGYLQVSKPQKNTSVISLTGRSYKFELTEEAMNKVPGESNQKNNRSNVFVVHGRNKKLRDSIFAFLRSLSLNPLEWSEAIRFYWKNFPLYRGNLRFWTEQCSSSPCFAFPR